MESPQKIKKKMPYHPVIAPLGIYPKKTKTQIWKDICTPVFTAASFTIVNPWKQLKCLLIGEWIKTMWWVYTGTHTHTHTVILLSHKQEWDFAICNNMDGPKGYYNQNKRKTETESSIQRTKWCLPESRVLGW